MTLKVLSSLNTNNAKDVSNSNISYFILLWY